jgi:hypothetical protein
MGQLFERVAAHLDLGVAEHLTPSLGVHASESDESAQGEHPVACDRRAKVVDEKGHALFASIEVGPQKSLIKGLY